MSETDMPVSTKDRLVAEARSLIVDEIEAATGLGAGQYWRRVRFALAPQARAGFARARLAAGWCSLERAMTVVQDTADPPEDVADLIARELLGSRPDGAPWSQRQFTSRLHRRVKKHQDADAAKVEHDRGVEDRGAWARLEEDGTGSLTLTGEADRVVAAIGRVDALARRLKQAGNPRTLSQLRADVAADLLLYGLIPDTAGAPPATGGHASTATGTSTDTGTSTGTQDGTGGSNDSPGAGNHTSTLRASTPAAAATEPEPLGGGTKTRWRAWPPIARSDSPRRRTWT